MNLELVKEYEIKRAVIDCEIQRRKESVFVVGGDRVGIITEIQNGKFIGVANNHEDAKKVIQNYYEPLYNFDFDYEYAKLPKKEDWQLQCQIESKGVRGEINLIGLLWRTEKSGKI